MEQKTKIYTVCASETYEVKAASLKKKPMSKVKNGFANFEDVYDLTC